MGTNRAVAAVDEKTSISDLVKTVEWIYTIVQNAVGASRNGLSPISDDAQDAFTAA